MMKKLFLILLISFLLSSSYGAGSIKIKRNFLECKNVMVIGNATCGDFNLLMKVRDPARPGYQVLCIVPKGYEYTYHSPWLGYPMHFVVKHKFIGTTTQGDTPPNIVKPGMLINDDGIAYGDADTLSYITNPSRHAWDDFDWLRYSAQSSANLKDAIKNLQYVVKVMHAPAVAENILVANATMGAVVEADAINFEVRYYKNGIIVQSNYPKMLWKKHLIYPIFVAKSFDSNFTGWVKKGEKISLGGLTGIYISKIEGDKVILRMYPFGFRNEIKEGEGMKVGNFYVRVEKINEGKALVYVCYEYFMWEKKIKDVLRARYGKIDVADLMKVARLHSSQLEGLRGMCEGGYEATTIYKINRSYPSMLSSLWFAANQCSSIFVPVHICDYDIYDAYENGEASKLANLLLNKYGHGTITKWCEEMEAKFINETEKNERKAMELIKKGDYVNASIFLTTQDMKMQMEAFVTEEIWLNESITIKNFHEMENLNHEINEYFKAAKVIKWF